MLKLLITAALSASLLSASACSKEASCEEVVDHTLSIMPDAFKADMDDAAKKGMIAKCEKESTADDRKCMMAAESMEDIMACAKKKKQG